jgi:hypothetical protein
VTLFASFGSEGQLMLHSCVDVMLFPSGITTVNLFFVGRIFFTSALKEIKWLVVPESNIP